MKKGFTLIELLAVIVILSIISVIATPIVLGIINDSKESAILRSAENYLEAVMQGVMRKNMSAGGNFSPSKCIVVKETGNLLCDNDLDELEISLKGEKPTGGTITFIDGKVKLVDLEYQDKKITKNNDGKIVFGVSNEYSICKLAVGEENVIGSKYECEVQSKVKYYFYVLSHNEDGTTNLIMERNICEDGSVATSNKTCLVEWNSNSKDPAVAITYLNNATSTWTTNLENTDVEKIKNVRLPYYNEVYDSGCLTSVEPNYKFGTCPIWLVNYLNNTTHYTHEMGKVDINGIWGYWTSSYVGNGMVWHVHYLGDTGLLDQSKSDHLGIRPVITINIKK